MTDFLKAATKNLLLKSKIISIMAKLTKLRIIILRYHSVQEEPERYANSIGAGIIHSVSIFEKQMEIVSREYHPVTLDDILSFLLGNKALPKKCIAVTFDDGFADNYMYALPILDKFGIRASFYITTNSVDSRSPLWFCRLNHAFANIKDQSFYRFDPEKLQNLYRDSAISCASLSGDEQNQPMDSIEHKLGISSSLQNNGLMMNWNQIRELRQRGHIVGSHSLSHPNLAHIDNSIVFREVAESKKTLEQKIGQPVVHFAYPGPILEPHYSPETILLTKKAGYQTAVTSTNGTVCKEDNPLALRRVAAPKNVSQFQWILNNYFLGRII